uniref:Uncharacterized protein n=1 Tax=Malurus cyaneus samueli TaxID=2593467 RepID=A0A8C5TGW0_9PASS
PSPSPAAPPCPARGVGLFFCSQLKEYQQKNSPGATAGTKKKRKTKEGSRPATPTTDDQQPPENVSLGSGGAGVRAEWCRCCMNCSRVVGSCLCWKVQQESGSV